MEYQETLRRQHNIKGREELELQMQDAHYKNMMEAQEEAEKDKAMVATFVRMFEEEDYREYMAKVKKVADSKAVIEAYKLQREEELREAARQHKAEEDRILAYARAKAGREATIKAKQDLKKAEEERRFKEIEAGACSPHQTAPTALVSF